MKEPIQAISYLLDEDRRLVSELNGMILDETDQSEKGVNLRARIRLIRSEINKALSPTANYGVPLVEENNYEEDDV